jgi:hypothetical protein
MFSKRKALIGYVTYVVGKRITQRVVRRQVRQRMAGLLEREPRRSRMRRLPLVGAALALAAGGALLVSRLRG